MNAILAQTARAYLKKHLAQLSESHRRIFKLMYGRDGGKRSVEDATAMNIDAIVDEMPDDKLGWAMTQVENSLVDPKGGAS